MKLGFKHQIRAHLSYGMQTPVLGDHKYSHLNFMAPQRLSKRLLQALQIRQSKVRYMNLNLHSWSIQAHVPVSQQDQRSDEFFRFIQSVHSKSDSGSTRVEATLPQHILNNLRYIRLKLPKFMMHLRV